MRLQAPCIQLKLAKVCCHPPTHLATCSSTPLTHPFIQLPSILPSQSWVGPLCATSRFTLGHICQAQTPISELELCEGAGWLSRFGLHRAWILQLFAGLS